MAHQIKHSASRVNNCVKVLALLAVAALLTIGIRSAHAVPVQAPMENPTSVLSAYVASIKPDKSGGPSAMRPSPEGFTATGLTLQNLIETAYGVDYFQILQQPKRASSEKYDVEAKVEGPPSGPAPRLNIDQESLLEQTILADRSKLAVHREMKRMPVYVLVLSNAGKLKAIEHDRDPATKKPEPPPQAGKWPTMACGGFFGGPAT
jgi:uncharacterized protein (TIGR03435 family)